MSIRIKRALAGLNASSASSLPDKEIIPALPEDKLTENSLLYILEKANNRRCAVSCENLNGIPYAIVASQEQEIINPTAPVIRVDNARLAFSYACSKMRGIDYERMKIIGITGTNGKTTTATLIYKILLSCGYKVGLIGTGKILICDVNQCEDSYTMTTPDAALLYKMLERMQANGCEYVVMEVSSHSIALEKVTPIRFEYGIFTNLSPEHLDFHKDIDSYLLTKCRLFETTKRALFNMDDKYARMAYEKANCEKTCIGIIQSADAYVSEVELCGIYGSRFYYRENGLICRIETRLPGAFNVYNILAALKCAKDLGIPMCIAKEVISAIKEIPGRMQIKNDGVSVIIDYAHTAFAFENCINFLFSLKKSKQKLIIVFGCGGNRDKSKRRAMGEAASRYADSIIITEDNSRSENTADIARDILSGISIPDCRVIANRENAIRTAILWADDGDIIAIIGKGDEGYKITNGKMIPSKDIEIAERALEERRNSL